MGASLPKACDAALIERVGTKSFDVGVTELNGWRTDMEDAHLIYVTDKVGVFGVYDGHGGKDCSRFAARRINEELEKAGVPETDAAWEELFIRIDEEFLDSDMESGTTATMCVVYKPEKAGDKHKLHVVNAGDSRVVLGRADGSIVDISPNGTDKGLTRDHKPEDPEEKIRIEAAGARVEGDRVNGNLSVCRGFGDRGEKQTGGPGPDNRPVTCIPEQYHYECDETDFVLLVCDGVSEGNFSNEEVVKLVADTLKEKNDGGHAGKLVCLEAINKNSKDNITCMVVQLQGVAEAVARNVEFIPCSVTKISNGPFRKAYEYMCGKAHLSLAHAVAQRYEVLLKELQAEETQELLDEKEMLGSPPGAAGSDERMEWAEQWLEDHPEKADASGGGGGPGGMDMNALMGMLGGKGGGPGGLDMEALMGMMGKGGGKGKGGGSGSGARESDPRVQRGPEVGDTIVVHGLKGAPELNGLEGKVLKWIASSGRWEVQLEGVDGTKGLKVDNLRVT